MYRLCWRVLNRLSLFATMMKTPTALNAIQRYLSRQHVFSIFTFHTDDYWPATCFYIFDKQEMSLIFMTEGDSRHGQLMQKNPAIAGTVSAQTKVISKIQGIQFRGQVIPLYACDADEARHKYCRRFPVALAAKTPIWKIYLQEIKMVNNTLGFGSKLYWQRED